MNNRKGNNNIIIMAAGMSSRMKQELGQDNLPIGLSKEISSLPKCMIRVGKGQKPFLYHLLTHVQEAGYEDVLIIINSNDKIIQPYCKGLSFNNMQLSFAAQKTPAGKTKPMGTSDAVLQGLLAKPEWKGKKFTVCNADNLYSSKALYKIKTHGHPCAMIEFDRQGLGIAENRISGYSIVEKDEEDFISSIIEKPTLSEIAVNHSANSGVNMNLYHLDYDLIFPHLQACPITKARQEKELTTAVSNMIKEKAKVLYAISLTDQVLDLTFKKDITIVNEKIK